MPIKKSPEIFGDELKFFDERLKKVVRNCSRRIGQILVNNLEKYSFKELV